MNSPAPENPGTSAVAPDTQGSAEIKPIETTRSSVVRRIVLVFLWLGVISTSFSYIMLILGESSLRHQLGATLFFGYGFLVAMYAKRFKILWFFAGGVGAILVFGALDGLIRRALHGLPIFT